MYLSRREFLRVGALFALAVPAACRPRIIPTISPEATSTPYSVYRLGQFDYEVMVGFRRLKQPVYAKIDPSGPVTVFSCDDPYNPVKVYGAREEGTGFVYEPRDFDWKSLVLPEIKVGTSRLPVLTTKQLDGEAIEFLEAWYADPILIEKELARENLPEINIKPRICLVVHFRSVRDNYWRRTLGDCIRIFDDSPSNDPQALFGELRSTLVESTNGVLDYRQAGFEVMTEEEVPLTDNPDLTYPDLITAYRRTINYQRLAELAVKYGASTVFTYAGPTAGMHESASWIERNSGEQITIFGLNYEREHESQFHSYLHYVEKTILESKLRAIFLRWSGRLEEDVPIFNDDSYRFNLLNMNDGILYAAIGFGSVHLPPNSIRQAIYDSPIPVTLPGKSTITSSLWGGTEPTYFSWWLKSMPRAFLSAVV